MSSDEEEECFITGNIEYEDWESLTPQLQTVFLFLQGMRDANYEMLEQTLSEDYKMEVLPRSLGIPMRGRDDWLKTCKESNILEPGYRVRSSFLPSVYLRSRVPAISSPSASTLYSEANSALILGRHH